jgi:hypothetical protein
MEPSLGNGETTKIEDDEISVAGDEKDVSFRDLVSRIGKFSVLLVTIVCRI